MQLTRIRLGCERFPPTLNYPSFIDHCWLFIARNIHAQPFIRTLKGTQPDLAKNLTPLNSSRGTYKLEICSNKSWIDGSPISIQSIAAMLRRGAMRLGLLTPISSKVEVISSNSLQLQTADCVRLEPLDLAHPAFTLTSPNGAPQNLTAGPYRLVAAAHDRSWLRFERLLKHSRLSSHSPKVIELIPRTATFTYPVDLTPTLGLTPRDWQLNRYLSVARDQLLDVYVVMTGARNISGDHAECFVAEISSLIDRSALVRVSGNTMVEWNPSPQVNVPRSVRPAMITVQYTQFPPNAEIAHEIANQFRTKLSIDCVASAVNYDKYIEGQHKEDCALKLELIVSFADAPSTDKETIPLLRCRCVSLRKPQLNCLDASVLPDGTLDWSALQLFNHPV